MLEVVNMQVDVLLILNVMLVLLIVNVYGVELIVLLVECLDLLIKLVVDYWSGNIVSAQWLEYGFLQFVLLSF